MSVWGIIAVHLKKPWAWITGGFLIFFIGFSRLYLGSHFPHDVLLGWIIGGLLLFSFSRFGESFIIWFTKRGFSQQILVAFLTSLVFILLGFTAATLRSDFQVPDQWITNALRVGPEPAPVDTGGIFSTAGTLLGLVVGAAWVMKSGGYQVSGPVWNRAVRYLLGLVGVLVLWMGLGVILPRGDGFIFYLLRYMRYSLVGLWVAGGAPWVFMRFSLSDQPKSSI